MADHNHSAHISVSRFPLPVLRFHHRQSAVHDMRSPGKGVLYDRLQPERQYREQPGCDSEALVVVACLLPLQKPKWPYVLTSGELPSS